MTPKRRHFKITNKQRLIKMVLSLWNELQRLFADYNFWVSLEALRSKQA